MTQKPQSSSGTAGLKRDGFFLEATLPTSYVFSVLAQQCGSVKMHPNVRAGPCKCFFELLMATVRAGNLQLSFESSTRTGSQEVSVPTSGAVPTEIVMEALSPRARKSIAKLWSKDTQASSKSVLSFHPKPLISCSTW